MNSKAIMVVFGILSIAMVGISPTAIAEITTNSMSIDIACGIDVGSSLEFGDVDVNTDTNEIELLINGTGSATSAIVEVIGSDWLDGSLINQINGERTAFATSADTSYASKTQLNSTNVVNGVPVGNIIVGGSNSTYWQVDVTLNDETFDGSITQTMTFTSTGCN